MCWASWAWSEVLRKAPHTHGSTLQMNLLSLSAHGSLSSSKSVKQIMLPVIGFSVLTRFGSSQRCYMQDVTHPFGCAKRYKVGLLQQWKLILFFLKIVVGEGGRIYFEEFFFFFFRFFSTKQIFFNPPRVLNIAKCLWLSLGLTLKFSPKAQFYQSSLAKH